RSLGRTQGASISVDMGATEDAAGGEQRGPAAQTVFRQTLLVDVAAVAVARARRRQVGNVLFRLAPAPQEGTLGDPRRSCYVLAPGACRLPELRLRQQRRQGIGAEVRFEHEHGFVRGHEDLMATETANSSRIK